MYLLLKRLVFKVNQQSMKYFVDKLKAYDNLIDNKENKIKELDELINDKENELNKKGKIKGKDSENVFLYDLGTIKYKDENTFKKFKEVDEKFNYDNKKIIEDFINEEFDDNLLVSYKKYKAIRKKFTSEIIFQLFTKRENDQIKEIKTILGDSQEILDDFIRANRKFDLKKFISYLNKIVNDLDPHIYVYVGNKNDNYSGLSKYIKTVYDKTIFKGLKIIYKGKLYDYSI